MPTFYDAFYDANATSSAIITSASTWIAWNTDDSSTAITAYDNADAIWVTWTTGGTAATTGVQVIRANASAPVDTRTAEQKAADEARWQRELNDGQRRAAAAEAVRVHARDKARALLAAMLSAEQREQLQRLQYFEVIAQSSQRRYRIHQGTHGNVRLLDAAGREVTRYCGQPNDVPTEDAMLAQKLQIEHDEAAFLRVANATRLA